MGANCAGTQKSERESRISDCRQVRQVTINLEEWRGTGSKITMDKKQNFVQYTTDLTQFTSAKKFQPKFGFLDGIKIPSFNEDYIIFKSHRTDTSETIYQTEFGIQGSNKLWKKADHVGCEVRLNQQVKLGGNLITLRYFQNRDQIQAMKDGCEEIQIKQVSEWSRQCRICGQSKSHGPLIMPCSCFSNAVHQRCFSREIIDQSVSLDDHKTAFRFVIKKLECEHCHESYEKYVWKRFLSNLTVHTGNYAIFERKIYSQINRLENTEFLIFRFPNQLQQIVIGRSRGCDLSIPEDDIERYHAKLLVKNGALCIADFHSKTGTFVECKNNVLSVGETYLAGKYIFRLQPLNRKKQNKNTQTKTLKRATSQSVFARVR